jgi:flagellar FliJ protein
MRFSFRLQSLLNWKKNLEEDSQMRFAEKMKQLKKQEEEIQELVQRRVENDQELHRKIKKGIKLGEYLVHKQYGEDSYDDLLLRKDMGKRMEAETEGERENLIGLMKERKILEKIKEKRLKKFLDQMEKLEQKNVDEMVVQKYQDRSNLLPPSPQWGEGEGEGG